MKNIKNVPFSGSWILGMGQQNGKLAEMSRICQIMVFSVARRAITFKFATL